VAPSGILFSFRIEVISGVLVNTQHPEVGVDIADLELI
jgi:hypothetical protein